MSVDVPTGTVVLRRRSRVWPVEAVAAVVVYALVAATISLHKPEQTANRYNLYLGIAVLVVGVVLTWRRPTVTLRPDGLTVRGRHARWDDISAINDVSSWRSRYVRIYVSSQARYWRPPALRTSRILPGRGYARNVAELDRWAAAYTGATRVTAERTAPAWILPAVVAVVLAIVLSTQDPVQYWLPRAEIATTPAVCDADPTHGLTPVEDSVYSPIMPGTRACLRRGDSQVLVLQVIRFHRSALQNGAGFAHYFYDVCSFEQFDRYTGQTVAPLPADEASASGYQAGRSEAGVYLIARKANVIVFVAYSSVTAESVPGWPCDPGHLISGPNVRYGQGDELMTADPDDLRIATDVADQILRGLVLN